MANKYDKGMDDAYLGKEITSKDPGLEYLRGYSYAESLLYPVKEKEQEDSRQQSEQQKTD